MPRSVPSVTKVYSRNEKRFEMLCNSRLYFYVMQQKHRLGHQSFKNNFLVLSVHISDVHFLLLCLGELKFAKKSAFFILPSKCIHSSWLSYVTTEAH